MKKSIVTIGLFDGVHVGHRQVITRAVSEARAAGLRSVAVTFDRHPSDILHPGHGPLLLTDAATKKRLIQELGVDEVLIVPFTEELSVLKPGEFLDKVVLPLDPANIVVGSDFKFGRNREGDTAYLSDYAAKHGFGVESLNLHTVKGEKASSSAAREHLIEGDVGSAGAILGRCPVFRGKVVSGEKRGRELGFPTANVELAEFLCLPRDGVYAGRIGTGGKTYAAVINVGLAPTFGVRRASIIEAYALDFDGDLYDQDILVEFCERIRGEKKFDNAADLAKQIADDAQKARTMIELTNTLKGG
ncbi:MAG: bifunctional riboflavin kinase/FAD synthetase [Actinomycetota bacterium]